MISYSSFAELVRTAEKENKKISDLVLADQAEQKRDELSSMVKQRREQLEDAISAAEQKMDKTVEQMHFLRKFMIKGNPTLKSTRFNETLEDLRKRLKK